jgi:hypothetical protein
LSPLHGLGQPRLLFAFCFSFQIETVRVNKNETHGVKV